MAEFSSQYFDYVIIGGGIVGLTVARELMQQNLGKIAVIDKETELGLHASGRNSGVIHSGIYYPPGSLKARFCREGGEKLKQYILDRDLPFLPSGKVIVAGSKKDLERLEEIERRGVLNGVKALRVDSQELKDIEPLAKTVEWALYVPGTAVVDPKRVVKSLFADLQRGGVQFFLGGACQLDSSLKKVVCGSERIDFGHLINAAGMGALEVGKRWGVGLDYRQLPFMGLYRELSSEKAAVKAIL